MKQIMYLMQFNSANNSLAPTLALVLRQAVYSCYPIFHRQRWWAPSWFCTYKDSGSGRLITCPKSHSHYVDQLGFASGSPRACVVHALNHHGSWPSPFTPSIHKVHRERGTENDFQVNKVITVILMIEIHIKYCESTTEVWINIYVKAILLLPIRNTSAYPWDGYCFSVVVIGAWFLLCFAFWKGKETPWVGWSYLKGIWRQPNSMQSMPPWGHLRVLTAT